MRIGALKENSHKILSVVLSIQSCIYTFRNIYLITHVLPKCTFTYCLFGLTNTIWILLTHKPVLEFCHVFSVDQSVKVAVPFCEFFYYRWTILSSCAVVCSDYSSWRLLSANFNGMVDIYLAWTVLIFWCSNQIQNQCRIFCSVERAPY